MPGEEYPHVSPGGSEWQRVSDAEAAVVFNQRTRGSLQLPAQQDVWEVIIHTQKTDQRLWTEGRPRCDLKLKEKLH